VFPIKNPASQLRRLRLCMAVAQWRKQKRDHAA
jgi:hypothetical protein